MDDDRKKYIDQWWRKYEAANEFDADYRRSEESLTPPQVKAGFWDSIYDYNVKSMPTPSCVILQESCEVNRKRLKPTANPVFHKIPPEWQGRK